MAEKQGYIKSYRKLIDGEGFRDVNTCHFFIYCLHRANYESQQFMGQEIPRGSFVSSLKHMADDTGLTVKQVRKCLEKLKNTQNVASKGTNKYTIVSVVNYDIYQDEKEKKGKQTGKQRANKGQQYKNIKNTITINSNSNREFYENEKLNNTFIDYLEVRKKLKVATSERAIEILINKLSEFTDLEKIEMLENAIVNGGKSVYPLKKPINNNLPF